MGDVKLPSLPTSIENMTRDSLRTFIPQLIRIVEKRENAELGVKAKKPLWWPAYTPWAPLRCDIRDTDSKNRIPWTEELRNIVRCCYRYHNSENMLHEESSVDPDDSMPILTKQLDIAAHSQFNGKVPASLEAKIPVSPRPLMCEVSLSPLPKYYLPAGDVPEQAQLYATKAQSQVRTSARLERKRGDDVHEIFVCEFCCSEFKTITSLKRHQNVCFKRPTNNGSHFHIPDCPPTENVEQIHVDLLPRARKVDLTERLGLLPISKAKQVRKQKSRVREIQITRLDEGDKDPALKSPTTPRAKSLISQLSRDFSPPAKARRKSLFSAFDEADGTKSRDLSDAESVSSKSSEKTGDNEQPRDPWNKEKRSSILSIDFSSPLGMRVVKLMNQQAEKLLQYAEETTTNYEDFCRTPKKSEMIRRLRDRKDLITFKKNRRICPKWAHSYKFTRAERIEWYRTIRTGLNARSRPLRKLLKKCSVRIQRLTSEEIKKWTTPKPRPYVDFKQLSVVKTHQMQNWLRQQSPQTLSRVFGLKMNGSPSSAVYQSVLNEMQYGGSSYLSPNGAPSSPNRAVNLIRNQAVLKSLMNRSPEQLRAMSNTYPIPSGMYANLNNRQGHPQMSKSKYDLPRAVAENVVRNLHHQMNYGPGVHKAKMSKNQNIDFNGNRPNQKLRANNSTPIVIDDDDDDDVVMVSSSGRRSRSPPAKRRKVETETSLLFKCHLCGEELTCSGSFAAYIEKHFADKHNVRTIQLIEHIDQNGQKVVSIVEKQAPSLDSSRDASRASNQKSNKAHSAQKASKTPMTTPIERQKLNPRASSRSASLSPKARVKPAVKQCNSAGQKNRHVAKTTKNGDSTKRKSNRSQTNASPIPVICID